MDHVEQMDLRRYHGSTRLYPNKAIGIKSEPVHRTKIFILLSNRVKKPEPKVDAIVSLSHSVEDLHSRFDQNHEPPLVQ